MNKNNNLSVRKTVIVEEDSDSTSRAGSHRQIGEPDSLGKPKSTNIRTPDISDQINLKPA